MKKRKIKTNIANFQILHDLMQSSAKPAICVDVKGCVVDLNAIAIQVFNIDKSVVGQNYLSLEIFPHPIDENKITCGESPLFIETQIRGKSARNAVAYWQITAIRSTDGHYSGFVGIAEIKEEALSGSVLTTEESSLNAIFANMPGIIYWKNLNSEYMGCNNNLARISGFKDSAEIIGKKDENFYWGKYAAEIFRADDLQVMKTGKVHVRVHEAPVSFKMDKFITVRSEKMPLINAQGEIIGIIGVAIDITAEIEAQNLKKEKAVMEAQIYKDKEIAMLETEKAIMKAQIDKDKEIAMLETEKAIMKVQMEKEREIAALERENALNAMRIETINRFCRKLLHDIRSPLSTLRMLITVLCKATLEGDSTVDLVRIRGTAYRCIRRIEAMANSLLRQYRHQGSEDDPQIEPTLLMPLVVDALLEKRSTLSMEDIKLKQEMQGAHSLSSKIECFELVQIFSNLINNCAEAIVEKREKIGDKKAEGLVRFQMTEQKEHVHFAISDNGCGIPQNLLEDIFLKDKTTKKEGSGIGLFHAREGIDSWGGKIWAESEDGKGATMNILLPKSPVPPSWFATQIEVPKNGFLVVADDEPHLYYSIKKCVQEQNLTKDIQLVEIKTLSEFDEWYEKHKEENPVILMDYLFYNEQKRTGLDAIKENELKNAILVTNIYDDVFLRKECTDAGVQLIPKNIIDRIPLKVIG